MNSERVREFLAAVFVMVLIISTIVSAIYYYFFLNYAEIEARTIEQALVEGGAVKKCGYGGSGFIGIDDKASGYGGYYELPLERQDVIELINEVSANNEFSLKQARPGDLPIPDNIISNYYIDHNNESSYTRHKKGLIKLTFEVINRDDLELSSQLCNSKEPVLLNSNGTSTTLRFDVSLPEVR